MAEIKIDLKKVRNANHDLPPMMSNLSERRRYLGRLKGRIPSEIQGRRDIGGRLDSVLREMDRAERQLGEVYRVTGSAVTQYRNMETNLTANAARFQ